MSKSLYYEVVTPPEGVVLSDELKRILIPKFNLQDGPEKIDLNVIPYLEGLRDGGVPGAMNLISALKKHGILKIYIAG